MLQGDAVPGSSVRVLQGCGQEKGHYVGLAGARSLAGSSEPGRAGQTCSREQRQVSCALRGDRMGDRAFGV